MDKAFKESIWKQFGASIDMFENAIKLCPEALWSGDKMFWYYAYHTLFFLDYYLSLEPDKFAPPPPFTLSEFYTSGPPEIIYTKEELLNYLKYCKNKCRQLINDLTDELAAFQDQIQAFSHFFRLQTFPIRHMVFLF